MKKGFTLIEVLAVVVILGTIIAIFVPNTIKILKDNNLRVYKIKEKELLQAAEDYVKYDDDFIAPDASQPTRYITIDVLVSKNYINKILDGSSGNECPAFVKVTKNGNDYSLDPCIICGEYKSERDFCTTAVYQNI